MTGLLVSVRNADEAREAMLGGADLIDIKEPSRGALGAADAHVWDEVRAAVGSSRPLSVALGELLDGNFESRAARAAGMHFAKIGLAHCAARNDWPQIWQRCLSRLPRGTGRVAVAYADCDDASAPPPRDVLKHAIEFDCRALLVDTCGKSRGGLFDFLTIDELAEISRDAHRNGMLCVVAGSLDADSISRAIACEPDYIAVRRAACRGGRSGRVDRALVQRLSNQIAALTGPRAVSG